jgi:hypothetical protein
MSPDQEETIRERAYAIWEREGRPEGRSIAHWLQAEDELVHAGLNGVTEEGKPVRAARAANRSRAKAAASAPAAG